MIRLRPALALGAAIGVLAGCGASESSREGDDVAGVRASMSAVFADLEHGNVAAACAHFVAADQPTCARVAPLTVAAAGVDKSAFASARAQIAHAAVTVSGQQATY